MSAIDVILMIVSILLMIFWVAVFGWHVVIGLRGLLPFRKPVKEEEKQNSFAILVCARNEENVIGKLIDSVQAQDYPRDKFDIFCVADNCSDGTAAVARQKGAEVLERQDTEHIGKGYALEAITAYVKENHPDRYDAFMVFDADNLLEPDFLRKMNAGLCSGYDIVTGFRDTKNPFDSWVSGCYDIFWTLLMRMFAGVRFAWGLSCMVFGTGFAVKAELLENGWNTTTVTEDGEFSMTQRIRGKRIALIRDAHFYDEQPTKLRHFFSQFHRWEVGGVQCCKKLWEPTIEHVKRDPADGIDCIAFLLLPYAQAAMLLSFIPYIISLIISGVSGRIWMIALCTALFGVLAVILLGMFGLACEHKPIGRMWRSVLLFPIFTLPMSVIATVSVIRPQVKWKAIPHQSEVDMANVGEIPPDPLVEKMKNLASRNEKE